MVGMCLCVCVCVCSCEHIDPFHPSCMCVSALVDPEEKVKKQADDGDQEGKETEEEKKSSRTAERVNTVQHMTKTKVEGEEEIENRTQQETQQPEQEEGDNNPGMAVGSLQGSDPNDADKKKPESHTEKQQQCQNGTQCVTFLL